MREGNILLSYFFIKGDVVMKYKYKKVKTEEEDEKPKKLKTFNYGLALLKFVSTFLVLVSHNFKPETTNNKLILFITKNRRFHVT